MWNRVWLLAVLLTSILSPSIRAEDPKSEPPARKPPSFKTPKGWEALELDKLGIATARFRAGNGANEATIVVVGSRGDGNLVANVNRWRGVVGLKALNEADALKSLMPIKVDGLPAHLLDITGPEVDGKPAQRAVAIVVTSGDNTWFLKIGGSSAAVGEHKNAFEEFAQSVRFEK